MKKTNCIAIYGIRKYGSSKNKALQILSEKMLKELDYSLRLFHCIVEVIYRFIFQLFQTDYVDAISEYADYI